MATKAKQNPLMQVILNYAKATANKMWDDDQGSRDAVAKSEAEYNIAFHNLQRALARKPNVVSFAIGDVVKVRSTIREIPSGLKRKRGEDLIITNADISGDGTMIYGVNGSAWHRHDTLTLVSRAIPATLRKALSLGRDDEEEDEEC
jgi:hypothetical protein